MDLSNNTNIDNLRLNNKVFISKNKIDSLILIEQLERESKKTQFIDMDLFVATWNEEHWSWEFDQELLYFDSYIIKINLLNFDERMETLFTKLVNKEIILLAQGDSL